MACAALMVLMIPAGMPPTADIIEQARDRLQLTKAGRKALSERR